MLRCAVTPALIARQRASGRGDGLRLLLNGPRCPAVEHYGNRQCSASALTPLPGQPNTARAFAARIERSEIRDSNRALHFASCGLRRERQKPARSRPDTWEEPHED